MDEDKELGYNNINGGISGAITHLDNEKAKAHGDLMYEEIRKRTADVEKISKNTGYSKKIIREIKNYLFINKHDLGDRVSRFDSDFSIAQSWDRLTKNEFVEHDLILLKHEIYESELIAKGMSQRDAHILASKKYNYKKESGKYYAELKKRKKRKK